MGRFGRIVVVTKKTPLEDLMHRFVTREQARFYLEHMGLSFDEYELAHIAYQDALELLKESLPGTPRALFIDRSFLPTYLFFDKDLVITLGNNGLVVNTAKYLDGQPMIGVNAEPAKEEGILVPYVVGNVKALLGRVLAGQFQCKKVTMASASLNDGQELLAFNDLFIGRRGHASARYRILHDGKEELQSSSGIIVTTGAGSTGWMRSIITGALTIAGHVGRARKQHTGMYNFDWSSNHLQFAVREPWPSRSTQAGIVFGRVDRDHPLTIVSSMPEDGVIFSDGVERDALSFNSGSIATIGIARKKANLIVS